MIKLTDLEFTEFVKYMGNYYGIDLSKKRDLIEGRLSNIVKNKGMNSFSEYMLNIKKNNKEEIVEIVNRLTTNYTYFYREKNHFEFLKNIMLKDLEKNSTSKILNVWSAGCSSGEEPYTIAMVLDDYFGFRKLNWKINIKATDISENVLDMAREGIYLEDSLKQLPIEYRNKYFEKIDRNKFKVVDSIKEWVSFSNLNLVDPLYEINKYDLIFCRNVMIYFDEETKENILSKFYTANKREGYLMIGHSESIIRSRTNYGYIKPAIYRKI